MNHRFRKLSIEERDGLQSYRFTPEKMDYYKCEECGLVAFEKPDTGRLVVSGYHEFAFHDGGRYKAEDINCNELIIREIIE